MSSIPKIIDQSIYFFIHFPGVINFLIFTFPDFIKRGKIPIETKIQDSSNKKINEFRTIIQLDADVISFIPDPDLFKNDTELYKEKCQEHQKKVTEMLTKLDGINTFIGVIISILTLILYMFNVRNEILLISFIIIILTFVLRWFIFKLLFFVFPRFVNLIYLKVKDNIPGLW